MSQFFEKLVNECNQKLSLGKIAGKYKKQGNEYLILNPNRSDSSFGSFKYNETSGKWQDFATGEKGCGLFQLWCYFQNKKPDLKTAKDFLAENENLTPKQEIKMKSQKEKPKPILPIPENIDRTILKKELTESIETKWIKKEWGELVEKYNYGNVDGELTHVVIKFEKEGEKTTIPFYYSKKGWVAGAPIKNNRNLYRIERLQNISKTVVVVEGEACADCVKDSNYIFVSWQGGSQAVGLTDWSPLAERSVIIWPDNDDAGIKAGNIIAGKLKKLNAEIKILPIPNNNRGWDIKDAVNENINVDDFISDCIEEKKENLKAKKLDMNSLAMIPLGSTDNEHCFLIRHSRKPINVKIGGWSSSILAELASQQKWKMDGFWKDKGNKLDYEKARDMLIHISTERGRYKTGLLRGSGAWLANNGSVDINTGSKLISADGSNYALSESDQVTNNKFFYIEGEKFASLDIGNEASTQTGIALAKIAQAQKFKNEFSYIALLGWCLIAPFCGVLKWRQHIWITGQRGTGKSWLFQEFIKPLLGEFCVSSVGKSTEAGIRNQINNNCVPVILNEMEDTGSMRDKERVMALLTLIRNASENQSAETSVARNNGGYITYRTISQFALASIQTPSLGSGVMSRFLMLELEASSDNQIKKQEQAEHLTALRRGASMRARTYKKLPKILEIIKRIKECKNTKLDDREKDSVAAFIASYHCAIKDDDITDSEIENYLNKYKSSKERAIMDEVQIMDSILFAKVRLSSGYEKTVAELLKNKDSENHIMIGDDDPDDVDVLDRFGIKYEHAKDGKPSRIFIMINSPSIRKVVLDEGYSSNYAIVLSRHFAFLTKGRRRFAAVLAYCLSFDYEKIILNKTGEDDIE